MKRVGRERLNLSVLMLLIAGAALGLWLVIDDLKRLVFQQGPGQPNPVGPFGSAIVLAIVYVLGGLSSVGVPLLFVRARRRPWGAGRFLWFVHGTATWLLWPPIVYRRASQVSTVGDTMSGVCYYYGTPIMAVHVTLTLLAGGHLNRSRRRRILRSWQETFGLLLGLVWACTGLYLISLFYRQDIFGLR